jgi:hypothetical protein
MQGSSPCQRQLGEKGWKMMKKNKDRSPRPDDLQVSFIVASNTNADSQKSLKHKRAKGLK